MQKKLSILLVAALLVSLLSVAVFAQNQLKQLPREETLYVNGLQWGPPATWNPLAGSPDWPLDSGSGRELLYETLFAFNMLNGQLQPLLATDYKWVDDYTLNVNLDSKAKWQNGNPVTADDVVYTFNMANKYSLSYSNIWQYLASVKKLDDTTVQFTLKKDNSNRLVLLHQLGFVYILPKAVFSQVEKDKNGNIAEIRKWANKNPVGSGPYKLYSSSNERIVLIRDDNYWGIANWGKPAPKYIAHVIYKSNDAGNRAFEQGQVDMSQQFIPQVWKMWEDKGLNIHTWYDQPPYYVPGSMPSLIINTTKKPMSDPAFRKALAYAIDYGKIAQLAMTKYSEPMKAGIIMPKEEQYFDQDDVNKFGWKYDPAKAEQILKDNGYTKGSDGMYRGPDGEKLGPFTVQCPYGWTDWMVSLKIVAQSARKIGIDIRTEFPESPVWNDRLQHGNFDFIMNTPGGAASPAQPWMRIRDAIYSRGVPEVGQMAFRNWGRYRNDRVNQLIDKIPSMTSEQDRIAAYKELNILFMRDVPIIPLEYRPWLFHTWSEKYWTNFPTADNPYAPPQIATDGAGIRTLYKIKPVK